MLDMVVILDHMEESPSPPTCCNEISKQDLMYYLFIVEITTESAVLINKFLI